MFVCCEEFVVFQNAATLIEINNFSKAKRMNTCPSCKTKKFSFLERWNFRHSWGTCDGCQISVRLSLISFGVISGLVNGPALLFLLFVLSYNLISALLGLMFMLILADLVHTIVSPIVTKS